MDWLKLTEYMNEYKSRLDGEFVDDIKMIGIMINPIDKEWPSDTINRIQIYKNASIPKGRIVVLTELREMTPVEPVTEPVIFGSNVPWEITPSPWVEQGIHRTSSGGNIVTSSSTVNRPPQPTETHTYTSRDVVQADGTIRRYYNIDPNNNFVSVGSS